MVKAIQNDEEMVKNVKSKVAEDATQKIFDTVINHDNYSEISHDIAAAICAELKEKTFMTDQLELTQRQKDVLEAAMPKLVMGCVSRYREKLNEDDRTKKIAQTIVMCCRKIIDESFSSVAKEINRGAIINGTAVSANSSNEKYNKLEFRYIAGDVCVPTRGFFVATNCVEAIENSVQVEYVEKKNKKKVTVTKEKTTFVDLSNPEREPDEEYSDEEEYGFDE